MNIGQKFMRKLLGVTYLAPPRICPLMNVSCPLFRPMSKIIPVDLAIDATIHEEAAEIARVEAAKSFDMVMATADNVCRNISNDNK